MFGKLALNNSSAKKVMSIKLKKKFTEIYNNISNLNIIETGNIKIWIWTMFINN